MMLRTQPTLLPTRKIGHGGIAGVILTVIVTGLAYAGIELSPEVASALGVLATFVAGYLARERA